MLFFPNEKRQWKSQGGGCLPHHSLVPENINPNPTEGQVISRNFQGVEELKKKKTMEILRAGVNNVKLLERENTWGWGIKLDKKKTLQGV